MSKVKILFVDDEPLICECFVEQFESADIQIITFTEPKQSIEYLQNNQVDLIFLDYRMPGQKGDELARLMPVNVPKYLVSGELDAQPNFEFADILPKPFDVDRMGSIIETCRSRKSL